MKKILFCLILIAAGTVVSFAQTKMAKKKSNFSTQTTVPELQLVKAQPTEKVFDPSSLSLSGKANAVAADPVAYYTRPQGVLYASWDSEGSYYRGFWIGAPYVNTTWNNASTSADTYEWQLPDPVAGGNLYLSNEENPSDFYSAWSLLASPSLVAKTATKTSKPYYWGLESLVPGVPGQGYENKPLQGSFLVIGGNIRDYYSELLNDNGDYMVSNVAPDTEIYAYSYSNNGGPIFGSPSRYTSFGSYFEKPLKPYLLNGVRIPVVGLSAPANTQLRLNIYKMDKNGTVGDLITSSSLFFANAVSESDISDLSFDQFVVIDAETGLDIDIASVTIDDAVLIELTGYSDAVTFTALANIGYDPFGYFCHDNIWRNANTAITSNGAPIAASPMFLIDATFAFFYAEETRKEAPVGGGTVTFEIDDYYWLPMGANGSQWWLQEELPEWIELGGTSTNPTTGVASVPVMVKALPAGQTGRSADIIIASVGCDLRLQIKQGDAEYLTSMPQTKATTNAKAMVSNDAIMVSYLEGTTSVAVYNVSGQRVAEYALPSTGNFTIPAASLNKGVYVLKFTGKTDEVIKIVK